MISAHYFDDGQATPGVPADGFPHRIVGNAVKVKRHQRISDLNWSWVMKSTLHARRISRI